MSPPRKKPPLVQQRRILSCFGNTCGICGRLLNVKDLHHIVFYARGGNDSDENFIPLHPTCHNLFPHKLEHIVSTETMKQLRNDRIQFNKLDSLIFDKLRISASEAASVLLDSSVQPLILRFGSYERYLQLALDIEKELIGTTPSIHVQRDRLRLFMAEMSLYLDREDEFLEVALAATTRLDRSLELSTVSKMGWLISSRLAGRLNRTLDEEQFLENSYPIDSNVTIYGSCNWYFRALAFYKKIRRYDEFDFLAQKILTLNHQSDELMRNNIQSEIARVRLYRGDPNTAYTLFSDVLTSSIQSFHLRGVFVTALFLAKSAFCAGRYDAAAKALLICSEFRDQVARNKEKSAFEILRIRLERQIGRDNLIAIWADKNRSTSKLCGIGI